MLAWSERTVFRFADGGLMPGGYKIGALRRWDRDEIEAWIAGGCKPVRAPGRAGK
jgi:predicted DNA-binding transcriptional regulator AlpA